MSDSAERKMTAAEEIVRQLEVDDPMTDNVREYTTQWISAIIAASYERREPPAGPSCTVCGTAMQWECPKCGSTPQCTEAASVSEPAALFSISEASCIVHDIIEQYQSNLLGGECAAVLLRAIGLKRAASVSPVGPEPAKEKA